VEAELRERFELLERAPGADGIVTVPGDPVDARCFDAVGPQLRIVAQFAVGYDNVDVDEATERGILVTNTPDVLTAAVAEFTLALILSLTRRVVEGDRLVRRGEGWAWGPTVMLGEGLAGKTLGIVGYGRIGREVGRLAEALGMRVLHTKASPLDDVLREADVLSLHVPLTDETRHLVGARELAVMKPQSVLINTSRGPVVDEQALADAIASGSIAGAALDVYEREPTVHPRLLALENVVLTPHVASATRETRDAMGMAVVEALRAVLLDGRIPPNAVNPRAWSPVG
jgi:glyoxylate reductase